MSRSGRKVQRLGFLVVMATMLLGGGCYVTMVVKQLLPGYGDGVGDGKLVWGDGVGQNEEVVLKKKFGKFFLSPITFC